AVKALSERWIEARHSGRSRDRYIGEIQRTLKNHVIPHIGSRDAASIERSDILDLLDKAAKHGRLVPNHVLSVVRPLFAWAVERGAIDVSPAAGIRTPANAKPRNRVLNDAELAAFVIAVGQVGEPWSDYLEILALTGQRRNEVAGMTWDEVDLTACTWTIAADRTKNNSAHVIPLAPRAVSILKARLSSSEGKGFLFPAERQGTGHISGFGHMKPGLDAKMLTALRDAEAKRGGDPDKVGLPNWTLHDLRRTAATNMAALGHPIHVVERVLNHLSGATTGGIIAVYQRHDYLAERRAALEAWAKHLKAMKI
ncbi:MAG: site-specific integrase, partial [Amphiplicatus sp.]